MKNIVDLPSLMWDLIGEELGENNEESLLHLCHASPTLDELITHGSKKRGKLKLCGEKVFSILVDQRYLMDTDLRTCVKVSEDFGMFAATNWRFTEDDDTTTVELETCDEIAELRQRIQQSGHVWEIFMEGWFEILVPHANFRRFWDDIKSFLREYGKYILNLFVSHNIPELDIERENWLQLLPRLQFLRLSPPPHISNVLSTYVDPRTRTKFLLFDETGSVSPHRSNLAAMVAPEVKMWDVYLTHMDRFCNTAYARTVQELIARIPDYVNGHDYDYPTRIREMGLGNFSNIRKLVIHAMTGPLKCLEFVRHFPASLEELHLYTVEGNRETTGEFHLPVSPPEDLIHRGVKKLTLNSLPFPLDSLASILPSLTSINLKIPDANPHFNFQSDIWRHFNQLRVFSLKTVHEFEERPPGQYRPPRSSMTQRFTRTRGQSEVHRCQKIVALVTTLNTIED